jgi:hypothetical protein
VANAILRLANRLDLMGLALIFKLGSASAAISCCFRSPSSAITASPSVPKWGSLPRQSNDGVHENSTIRAWGVIISKQIRHLREQASRCASEQKFPQPRVTIGSEYEQVRSAPYGVREDHLRDRRAVRHHAFHVEMHTVPRQLQRDVGTGLFPVSAASGRIHDQHGDRLSVDKKRHRV